MTEIWRDIKGYGGLYQVSNLGNVKSLKFGKERILKPGKKPTGYLIVILCDNGRRSTIHIHRLVAEAFIHNPLNFPQVNHKDENPSNNRADNLEWCDSSYNINYGSRNEKVTDKRSIRVNQYTKNGVFIKQWKSSTEASRELSISASSLCQCCQGKIKSAGGFKWYYVDDYVQYIDQPLW